MHQIEPGGMYSSDCTDMEDGKIQFKNRYLKSLNLIEQPLIYLQHQYFLHPRKEGLDRSL